MKKNEEFDFCKVFLIGIGGISMSGLAKLLLSYNVIVAGSDANFNSQVSELKRLNIPVFIGHNGDNIDESYDLVVYSGAIRDDNCEIVRARELGIRTIERSEFLGILSRKYSHIIAISGTHGKTTTSAMLAEIFAYAGLNPTIHLGGNSVNLNSNTIVGDRDYLIIEACEYRESFKYLYPECLCITNIDADHLDYYSDLESIIGAFQRLSDRSQIIVCDDISITHNQKFSISDFPIRNLNYNNYGYDFDVCCDNEVQHFRLNMLGEYNVTNALFAIIVSRIYGIDHGVIAESLANFRGVERRLERIGTINSIPVIIDYAHHPTEIKSCLTGISSQFQSPLVIFQPHTYSRTLQLFDQFVEVLETCENLIIFSTYPAREKEIIGGRAIDLSEYINCDYYDELDRLIRYIQSLRDNSFDLILVLGAGDLSEKLRNELSHSHD